MRDIISSVDQLVGSAAGGHGLFRGASAYASARHVFNARAYGAVADGATDDTVALQAAIDAAYAADNGGTVFLPPGVYLTQTLTLKYRVSLVGPHGLFPSNATGAVLKLKASTNAPILVNDQANGGVAGTSVVGGGNQHYQYSTIENVTFDGNRANQTSMAADCIRITAAWHVTIKNCGLLHAYGFGLRALDCNVLVLRHNHAIFAPVYLESLADSLVVGNQMGGGNTRVAPVLWLASAGESCWQNLFSDNFVFNNSSNTAIAFPTATFDAATDVATTSAAHGWADGTPVIVTTTGTIPGGLALGTTYYAKSTGSTTLKFATTRANLAAATYVNVTGAGTGTHTIQVGENAGLYLSDAATARNVFANSRFDQNYGHGILCDAASDNVFTGNLVNTSGFGNATAKAGIRLQNGAVRNAITGGSIDGTAYTVGGNTSNQTVGVDADATSFDTRVVPGTAVRGHTTANLRLVGYSGSAETLSLGPDRFEAVSGSPALGTAGGGRRVVWLFDAASDELIGTAFWTPPGWRTLKITLWWVNAGAGSGDVTWVSNVGQYAAGDTLNATDALGSQTTTTAGVQDVLTVTTLSDVTLDEGKPVFLRIKRSASAGSDTLANDAALVAVRIDRG